MKPHRCCYGLGGVVVLCGLVSQAGFAATDVAPPKARDLVIVDAHALAEATARPATLPANFTNPFAVKAGAAGEDAGARTTPGASGGDGGQSGTADVVPPVSPGELIKQLAAQIPVTGSVQLNQTPFLLLGGKRLKVGDTVAVSLEGKNHELIISEINLATFTVRLGAVTHTRAIRISKPTP